MNDYLEMLLDKQLYQEFTDYLISKYGMQEVKDLIDVLIRETNKPMVCR